MIGANKSIYHIGYFYGRNTVFSESYDKFTVDKVFFKFILNKYILFKIILK